MAGNYPDVPGPRLAYDRDGSVGLGIANLSSVSQFSAATMQSLNNEATDLVTVSGGYSSGQLAIIFPELRDIVGYRANVQGFASAQGLQTSVDTFTGIDGTWVTQTNWVSTAMAAPTYRTSITAVSFLGIKGIRFHFGGAGSDPNLCGGVHLYGKIAAGQSPDRLRLWHPTLDQPLDDQAVSPDGAYFDLGNAPRSSTFDRTFRVKNNSATQTATTITLSREALTDSGAPTFVGMTTFSTDGGATFATTGTIASLAAGAISAVVTHRLVLPSDAALGLWTQRIVARATSWA